MPKKDDYQTLSTELERYTELHNRIATIDASFQEAMAQLIAECFRDDFQELQDELSKTKNKIESLVIKNPGWFEDSKTIKTPFGTVATRSTSKLSVPNEDATMALLELRGRDAAAFLRERKYISLEALEALDDCELEKLKVKRINNESIRITPAKIDLGKSIAKTDGAKQS